MLLVVLLMAGGGLLAASQFFGLPLYAVAVPSHTITPPLSQGDLALVENSAIAKIKIGELVGVGISRDEQEKDDLPAHIVGEVIKVTSQRGFNNFFVEGNGRVVSVVLPSAGGASMGKVVALVPFVGYPFLFLSSTAGVITLVGLVLALSALLVWVIRRDKRRKSNVAEYSPLAATLGGDPRSFAKSMMGGRQRRPTEIGPLTSEARFT